MRNDHGADGNGALDGLCSEQHVCDGQRPVYDLQSLAGGRTGTFDYRERRRHLLALRSLFGIDRTPSGGRSKRQTLAVVATLTEEAYGISLAKLVEGEDWGPRESFVLNVILIATWGASCTMGAIIGAVVDVPTAIAAFVCTSLFICLLFSQRLSHGNVVAAVACSTIAGTAMTTPVALAELAPTAYAQIATAVIIMAIMAPILTGWVDKKFCQGKEDLSPAVSRPSRKPSRSTSMASNNRHPSIVPARNSRRLSARTKAVLQ